MPAASVEFSIARISKWLSMSLADNTWHAYIARWNEWMKFKTSFPKHHYQGDSDVLLSLVLEQVEAQYSLSAITKKLAGISFFLKVQGRGTTLWLGNSTEQSICPVLAFSHYQQVSPCLPGPFFIHSDGSFVTRFQFVKIVKGAVRKLGIPPDHYNTHSFRIGAATQASLMGLGEEFIKRLGRWNSSMYQLYVRPALV
ncbi:hypothetical protein XELAEV_18014921mg [Xenopus laevis]|uniref:Tyr recombinase domain-containing protein n=1 Tax=Xenopus laevis TaxID=8355 RepID=A0A974HVF7_XENLA|nr:hypothetical protein XELAEV_18014921mg [Xenopus laevis]